MHVQQAGRYPVIYRFMLWLPSHCGLSFPFVCAWQHWGWIESLAVCLGSNPVHKWDCIGAGIAQWLEHWLYRGWDSSVVRAPDLWLKGRGFKSQQEQWENFLLQGRLSVLLFRYLFHPHVTAVACKRPWSFCQKCRWQVTAKHSYTLCLWLCMKWHGAWLYGVHRTCAEMAAVSFGTSHVSAVSTPLQWILKKKL